MSIQNGSYIFNDMMFINCSLQLTGKNHELHYGKAYLITHLFWTLNRNNTVLRIFSEKKSCSNNGAYCPQHSCKKLRRSLEQYRSKVQRSKTTHRFGHLTPCNPGLKKRSKKTHLFWTLHPNTGQSGHFKTKFQVFQVKNSEIPGLELQRNCEIPGGFYAGSPEGQALVNAL